MLGSGTTTCALILFGTVTPTEIPVQECPVGHGDSQLGTFTLVETEEEQKERLKPANVKDKH